jgi:Zn-finger protein
MSNSANRSSFSFMSNTDCEYFPCHESDSGDGFNCLFCFCPLYGYEDCGGLFSLTADKHKDCSACTLPHSRESYGIITARLKSSEKTLRRTFLT